MSDGNSNAVEFATVADVADAGLCCFCGACEGVCPQDSISLDLSGSFPRPVVDSVRCTHCGFCVEICPGLSVDFDAINSDFFGKPAVDRVLGNYIDAYIGGVTDPDQRNRRTSGGIAKGIGIWGLEKGYWQGVVVSRFCGQTIGRTEAFIATTAADVESSSSSLYCPVPVCSIWKLLRDFSGKVCMVALPCQIHALRKAQQKLGWLREKVAFVTGLFCCSTPGFAATEAFLKYHGIDPDEISSLEYRSQGWPGEICVHLRESEEIHCFKRGVETGFFDKLRFGAAFHRRGGFADRRCLTCADYTAEFADVSLGDAWGLGPKKEKLGLNIVLVRSTKAHELFEEAQGEGRVFLETVSRQQVVGSHRGSLLSKKKCGAMFGLLRRKNNALPLYTGQPVLGRSVWESLVARLEMAQWQLARNRRLWALLPLMVPLMSVLRRIAGRTGTKL